MNTGVAADAWRLAVGTLTALPVSPPSRVDAAVARRSVFFAPVAALPLGLLASAVAAGGLALGVPSLVTGLLVVAAVALGNRALHVDGLSDTVDGLAASFDRERSLAVMKSGTSGPAGVAATAVVLGIQAAAAAALSTWWGGVVLIGVAVSVSRAALALGCLTVFPPARADGLGQGLAGAIKPVEGALLWGLLVVVLGGVGGLVGLDWWRGGVAVGLAAVVTLALLARANRRLGGVTGDVFGAAIEVASAVLLASLA